MPRSLAAAFCVMDQFCSDDRSAGTAKLQTAPRTCALELGVTVELSSSHRPQGNTAASEPNGVQPAAHVGAHREFQEDGRRRDVSDRSRIVDPQAPIDLKFRFLLLCSACSAACARR